MTISLDTATKHPFPNGSEYKSWCLLEWLRQSGPKVMSHWVVLANYIEKHLASARKVPRSKRGGRGGGGGGESSFHACRARVVIKGIKGNIYIYISHQKLKMHRGILQNKACRCVQRSSRSLDIAKTNVFFWKYCMNRKTEDAHGFAGNGLAKCWQLLY